MADDEERNSPREYRGKLNAKQIADGMCAALRNARRLLSDAILLFEAKRYPSAISLAVLSIEEAGKVSIIRGFATIDAPDDIRQQWSNFRDHRSKSGAWILPQKVASGARTLFDLAEIMDRDGGHTELINSIKQLGFYIGCYGNAHWSEPDKIFDDGVLAEHLISTAKIFANKEGPTEQEILMWIRHLKPVWKTKEMPAGLMRFLTEMYLEGLTSTPPDENAKYIFGEGVDADWRVDKPKTQ